jgi:hypothetical protein
MCYITSDMYISIYCPQRRCYLAQENMRFRQCSCPETQQLRPPESAGGGRILPVSYPAAPVIRHPPQRGPSLPPQRPLGRTPNGRRPSREQAVSPVFLHCVSCRPPLRYASFRFTSAPLPEVGDPPRLALATPALAAGWLRGCWLTTTANPKKPKGQPDDHTSQVRIPDASAVTTP